MSSKAERLWFSTVIDAVFIKGLGDKLTPALKADIKAVGIDLDKMQPAYPIEVVMKAFRVLIKQQYAGMTEEEAFHQLGLSSMRGYTETLLGKALIQILKLIGVRRSLLRMHTSMRSGNNYLETFSTVVASNCIELKFSDVSGIPSFYQGILEEGGRMAHAKNLKVTTAAEEPPGHTFRVEWDE
jgi:uncharacterized protein (TIGR02265 family)